MDTLLGVGIAARGAPGIGLEGVSWWGHPMEYCGAPTIVQRGAGILFEHLEAQPQCGKKGKLLVHEL